MSARVDRPLEFGHPDALGLRRPPIAAALGLVAALSAAALVVAALVRVPVVVGAPATVTAGPGEAGARGNLLIALPQGAWSDVRGGQEVFVRAGASDALRGRVTVVASPRDLGLQGAQPLPLAADARVALARVTPTGVAVDLEPLRGRVLLAQVVVDEETALERVPLIGRLAG